METITTPTLCQHLKTRYDQHLDGQGVTPESPLRNDLVGFLAFTNSYLNQWRPAAINHKCEMNYLITLQDRQEVLISPPYNANKPGDMAPGRSVGMSNVKPVPGEASLEDKGAMQIGRG